MVDDSKKMTLEEVARYLRLGNSTVYSMAQKGLIPGKKVAQQWRFDRNEIEKWFSSLPASDERRENKLRILVVEDEEVILQELVEFAREACPDSVIHEAREGFSALEEIWKFHPHLILLDCRIPNVDGVALCRSLKSRPATKNMHVMAVSGFLDDDLKKRLMEARVDDMVQKPVGEPFVDRLRDLCQSLIPKLEPGQA